MTLVPESTHHQGEAKGSPVAAVGTVTEEAAVGGHGTCDEVEVPELGDDVLELDVLELDEVAGGTEELDADVEGVGAVTVTESVFDALATSGEPRYVAESTCVPALPGTVSDRFAKPLASRLATTEVLPSWTNTDPPSTGLPFAVTRIVYGSDDPAATVVGPRIVIVGTSWTTLTVVSVVAEVTGRVFGGA